MICYAIFAIRIDLQSKKWINTTLFELVVTCIEIETPIFVPSFSIFHVFISIIILFHFFKLLVQLFTFHIQHSKICSQHHLHNIFEIISSF